MHEVDAVLLVCLEVHKRGSLWGEYRFVGLDLSTGKVLQETPLVHPASSRKRLQRAAIKDILRPHGPSTRFGPDMTFSLCETVHLLPQLESDVWPVAKASERVCREIVCSNVLLGILRRITHGLPVWSDTTPLVPCVRNRLFECVRTYVPKTPGAIMRNRCSRIDEGEVSQLDYPQVGFSFLVW